MKILYVILGLIIVSVSVGSQSFESYNFDNDLNKCSGDIILSPGFFGNGRYNNGSKTNYDCGVDNRFRKPGYFSYSMWIKLDKPQEGDRNGVLQILNNGMGKDTYGVEVYASDRNLSGYYASFELHNNTGDFSQSITRTAQYRQLLEYGRYHHLIWTVNDSWVFLYVDGEPTPLWQRGLVSKPPLENPEPLKVIYDDKSNLILGNCYTNSMYGILDEVKLFDYKLSDEDAKALYMSYFLRAPAELHDSKDVFTKLEYNTRECDGLDCASIFKFRNVLKKDISGSDISFRFDDLEGNDLSDNIDSYSAWVGSTPLESYTFLSGEEASITLVAHKIENLDMDWKPVFNLKDGSIDISLIRSDWALWLRGPLVAQAGLNGLWNMNEVSGNFLDSSGFGNTLSNNGVVNSLPGVFNKSANFTGNSVANLSVIPSTSPLFMTADQTISIWWKPRVTYTGSQLVASLYGLGNNTEGYQYRVFYANASGLSYFQYNRMNTTGGNVRCRGYLNYVLGAEQWHNIVVRDNNKVLGIYLNGSELINSTENIPCKYSGTPLSKTNLVFAIGADYEKSGASAFGWVNNATGLIDEISMWNKSLTATEITDIFFESSLTVVNFTSANNSVFSSGGNITAVIGFGDQTGFANLPNITYTNWTGGINVLKTNATYETNTTGLQLTKVNATHYTILDFSTKTTAGAYGVSLTAWGGNGLQTGATMTQNFSVPNPTITWYNATPADLNSFNAVGTGLTLWYNFTTNTNMSNILLYSGGNTTDCFERINMTCTIAGGSNESRVAVLTSGTYAKFTVNDNDVYPVSFNTQENIISNNFNPTPLTLSSPTAYAMSIYNNLTTDQYQIVEATINSTSATPVEGRMCNGTFIDTPTNPSTSTSCSLFASKALNIPYNHTGFYSTGVVNNQSDQVFGFTVNSSKYIGSVPFFDGRYAIVWRGIAPGQVQLYYTNYNCRVGSTKSTTNSFTTSATQTYCFSDHVHHMQGGEAFYSYASGVNNLPGTTRLNSTVRFDIYDLLGIPPLPPTVYKPLSQNYSGTIDMNYTESISPNGYTITKYNISLWNNDFSFNKTVVANNTPNLGYRYDTTTISDGRYYLGVSACDSNTLCSDVGLSAQIQTDNTPPTVTITSPQNTSYLMLTIPLQLSTSDTNMPISDIWYSLDTGANTTYTIATTITTTNGGHKLIAYSNDTLGNVGQSNVAFTAQPIPPTVTSYTLYPTNIFYSQVTTASITILAGDGTLDNVWLQTAGGQILNISDAVSGAQTIKWYPSGSYGTYNVFAYVNDTNGFTNSSGPIQLVVQPPMNVSNDQNTNDLTFGRPIQAAVGVYTALLGGLFYALIIGVIFVALWLRTNNFLFPTLVLFTLTTVFGVQLPNIAQQLSYGIYAVALCLIAWKLWSPSYTQ